MNRVRVPIATASRLGVSRLASDAIDHGIVLTNHGRPVAVVDSAARLDGDVRLMRGAALAVLDAGAGLVSGRCEAMDLDGVCARLKVDAELVRKRAAERAAAPQ